VQRRRADDERRAAGEALGEDELHGAADRHDLLQRGLEAQAPELSHVFLGRQLRVVGDEGDALAGGAQGGDRIDRARRRLLAEPDAAVEVEQDVVVAIDDGAQRHGAKCDRSAVWRTLRPRSRRFARCRRGAGLRRNH
jgi:hypothetical protein